MGYRILAALALVSSLAVASPAAAESGEDWHEVDYVQSAATHAGPGKHPTAESDKFKLAGGVRWLAGGTVEYRLLNAPSRAAANAAQAGVATVDGYVTTRSFVRNDATVQVNPCSGQPNTIQWAGLDGPGGTLGLALVCSDKKSGAIGGFRITLDSGDGWATGNDGDAATFDVESVVAHEFGHVAGLGHPNSPADGCLTMYRFTGAEETQKRTLGWGDKLGLDAIYAHGDTSPGPGCGL